MNRRRFLGSALAGVAGTAARRGRAAAVAGADLLHGSAMQALAALRSGALSSHELTLAVLDRIDRVDPALRCFVTLRREGALAEARAADEARASGRGTGALLGLPVMVKDLRATAGIRTTYGSARYRNHVPAEDDLVVARLRRAGAVVIGKTNTPEFGADYQSISEPGGLTRNPWNPARTAGGSTGGGAAALAAGLGFLEIGSDMGGSIRTPAHFCGVYGHKPSLDLVPRAGPWPPGAPPVTRDNLWVNGPMARSAEDLALMLSVVMGPESFEALAGEWRLPPARAQRIEGLRLGYVLDDPFCPVSREVRAPLEALVDSLGRAGARLSRGWPPGIDLRSAFEDYYFLMVNSTWRNAEQIAGFASFARTGIRERYWSRLVAEAVVASHQEWRVRDARRLAVRAAWQDWFRDHDAFLLPANFCVAFPHQTQPAWSDRKVATADGARSYFELPVWMTMGSFSGCPATVCPAGRTPDGLPVGVQILGPYMEDATTLKLAALLDEFTGGFRPPPPLPIAARQQVRVA